MLRLTPPNYNTIQMSNCFEAVYGGSEANIAVALARCSSGLVLNIRTCA